MHQKTFYSLNIITFFVFLISGNSWLVDKTKTEVVLDLLKGIAVISVSNTSHCHKYVTNSKPILTVTPPICDRHSVKPTMLPPIHGKDTL